MLSLLLKEVAKTKDEESPKKQVGFLQRSATVKEEGLSLLRIKQKYAA